MCKTLDYSVLITSPPAPVNDCLSVRCYFKKNNIKIIHYFINSTLHFYYINTYLIYKFVRFVSFKKKHLKKSCEFHLFIIFLQRQTKTNKFMIISIKKQSFYTSLSSRIEDEFEVYMDDILFASCNTHDEASNFARGLRAGVSYLGKACVLCDTIPIKIKL